MQPFVSYRMSKVEPSILEPPSDLKRVVDKIVEFIMRNGKEFVAVLVQQDTKHGRFPSLLPSNQFHPYYLKVLQKTQESRLPGRSFIAEKHDSVGRGMDKKTGNRENETLSLGSDMPYDSDRKEKFKMVIGKSKKDGQDPPSKANMQQVGVCVDAAAAAAILQAATKGIKKPDLDILSKTINGIGQVPSNDGGDSHLSSRAQSFNNQKPDKNGEPVVSVLVTKEMTKTAANEADSCEGSFTREQKLKAERLKRAKMFAAMIKSGAAPLKSEPLRGLSVEPLESGLSGSDSQVICLADQEREGSSVPLYVDSNDKIEESEKKGSTEELNERRLKRIYRSRSKRDEEEEEEEGVEELKQRRDHKHYLKKRHQSSHRNRERHKHRKRLASSPNRESQHKHELEDEHKEKQISSSEGEHRHSRRMHKNDSSSNDEHGHNRHKRKHDSSSDDGHRHSRWRYRHGIFDDNEHKHSRRRTKRYCSSEDEQIHSRRSHRQSHENQRSENQHNHDSSSEEKYHYRAKSVKHSKTWSEREVDLEEGEILIRSDQSKASEGGDGASREASVDLSKSRQEVRPPSQPAEVSDDLRAKIRAMLLATL